jgi:signal transduction histidine kinase
MALRVRALRQHAETAPLLRGDGAASSRGALRQRPSASSFRIAIDEMGHVVDVAPLGESDEILGLQIQRRVSLTYQLERISPVLAHGLASALRDRRPCVSVDLGRGLDGKLYLLSSRLSFSSSGGDSLLQLQVMLPEDIGEIADHADALERRHARLTEMLRLLNGDGDIRNALKTLLPLLSETIGVEAVACFVFNDDLSASLLAAYGPTRQRGFPYADLDIRHPLLRALVVRPRLVQLSEKAPLPDALLAVTCRNPGLLVLAPAAAGRRVTALMVLSRADPCPLSIRDADLLDVVSEALAMLVENRELSAETQHSEPVLKTAYAVSRAISQSLDLDRTFQEIAVNAARVVAGAQCLLLESEPDGGDLLSVASSESNADDLVGLRFTFAEDAAILDDLRRRSSIAVEDVEWGRSLREHIAANLDMRSGLLVPMFAQNELVGALLLYSPGRRSGYSLTEVGHAEEVAEQAAIAIHNARLYRDLASSQKRVESLLSQLTRTREYERQRIARVVHDDIVQSIVGAVYRLDACRKLVSMQSLEEYDDTVSVLRRSIDEARRVIWELRPPVLDGLGLVEALSAFVDRADAEGRSRVFMSVADEIPELSPGVTTALYKIVREAVLNGQRHAEASAIWVSLWSEDRADGLWIRLKIEDDGVGLPQTPAAGAHHFGIAMMEEQATLIGGSVTIGSVPAQGTVVDVAIPAGSAEE